MTYLQLALYGVPAVVVHGNFLTAEEFSRWYTPVYLMNNWIWRQSCGISNKFCVEDELIKRALEPTYAALREIESLFPPPEKNTGQAHGDILSEYGGEIDIEAHKSRKKAHTIEISPQKFGEQISLFDEGGE
jgi:hypothetical protein